MTFKSITASIAELKRQAKSLRDRLRESGVEISHSKSLEVLAAQYGCRDWNTLSALAGNKRHFQTGERVKGQYLGQPFTAEVRGVSLHADGDLRRVTLHFDIPVDVVKFDSFSSFRQRVSGTVDWGGVSPQKTSDGVPQLVVEPLVG